MNCIKICDKKWIEVNDLSRGQCSVNKNVRLKTSILRSYLCDYSDAYIIVKGKIYLLAAAANENGKTKKDIVFENNTSFRWWITKINSTLIENVYLDMVMPMYNLLEYSQNYSMTSGSLWNYYRDEIDDVDDVSDGKSFEYKTIVGNIPERPVNEGDANRPPVPTYTLKSLFTSHYITVIFGDLLICHR